MVSGETREIKLLADVRINRCPKSVGQYSAPAWSSALRMGEQEDLLWIREPWTSSKGPDQETWLIHGHSPVAEVDVHNKHRITLDTDTVETGTLSALILFEDKMKLPST